MALNFVDLQPQSFLDYAWTSPTPAPPITAKSSKTNRKQNRCCDQCRKGKRACDAAILEDTLLDPSGAASNPTTFHYSDSFGCLAQCANCEKTQKTCTFEWLREQRIAQATVPQSNERPTKKRRTQNSSTQKRCGTAQRLRGKEAPQPSLSDTSGTKVVSQYELCEPRHMFGDFPGITPLFDVDIALSPPEPLELLDFEDDLARQADDVAYKATALEDKHAAHLMLDSDSISDAQHDTAVDQSASTTRGDTDSSSSSIGMNTIVRVPRKRRRRRSSSTVSAVESPYPSLCVAASNLAHSANAALLTEGLLKFYHDSFENHLSCWLTERTCPYVSGLDVSLPGDTGPDWNRIYHRVYKLDRAPFVRGRNLSVREEKAASAAVNLSILSYAAQANSNQAKEAKYPFRSDKCDVSNKTSTSNSPGRDFDRALRISTWHQARVALRDAAEIESFRVVLALLVFSLTQKPLDEDEKGSGKESLPHPRNASPKEEVDSTSSVAPTLTDDQELDQCEDLLSKLNLGIDNDGPSIYLEQGLRLVHSLRCRMSMRGAFGGRPKQIPRRYNRSHLFKSCLEPDDRATVDLLFWLGIMFDTLSAAIHKRPLVVSLEDSDLPAVREAPKDESSEVQKAPVEDLWDQHLYSRERKSTQSNVVRWPCSYEEATSLLCSAAPVKVLLFRKVTRLQTLMSRHVQCHQIEEVIQKSLELCSHWQKLYAPFIEDCIANHDRLPTRVQSWYICLASHWHLATLLLADLIEIVDDSELSGQVEQEDRNASRFVSDFKLLNCCLLSDMARCASPRKDFRLPEGQSPHFSMDRGAILTEPWIIVLVRAFATAGVLLLGFAARREDSSISQQEGLLRVSYCVRALQYMGQRSDAAFNAADLLAEAWMKEKDKMLKATREDKDVGLS